MSEWKKHDGGPMPCHPRAIVEYKSSSWNSILLAYAGNLRWGWHEHSGHITEYRIVESPREPVRETRYATVYAEIFSMQELCVVQPEGMVSIAMEFVDGKPDISTLRAVK